MLAAPCSLVSSKCGSSGRPRMPPTALISSQATPTRLNSIPSAATPGHGYPAADRDRFAGGFRAVVDGGKKIGAQQRAAADRTGLQQSTTIDLRSSGRTACGNSRFHICLRCHGEQAITIAPRFPSPFTCMLPASRFGRLVGPHVRPPIVPRPRGHPAGSGANTHVVERLANDLDSGGIPGVCETARNRITGHWLTRLNGLVMTHPT